MSVSREVWGAGGVAGREQGPSLLVLVSHLCARPWVLRGRAWRGDGRRGAGPAGSLGLSPRGASLSLTLAAGGCPQPPAGRRPPPVGGAASGPSDEFLSRFPQCQI